MLAAVEEVASDLEGCCRDLLGHSPPSDQWLDSCDCLAEDFFDLFWWDILCCDKVEDVCTIQGRCEAAGSPSLVVHTCQFCCSVSLPNLMVCPADPCLFASYVHIWGKHAPPEIKVSYPVHAFETVGVPQAVSVVQETGSSNAKQVQHAVSGSSHVILGRCHPGHHCFWKTRVAPSTVFFNNMAMVIGPTPPGTGVIFEALFLTSSNLTSPTSL